MNRQLYTSVTALWKTFHITVDKNWV